MDPVNRISGPIEVLDRADVDTDQIIPKQFLKRIERTGFGEFLFFDWRFKPDGSPNPDFELNQPNAGGASILVAGANFGCGSSREHAPWALGEYGFRVLIAPSFADIFYNNCCQTGLLPVRLTVAEVTELIRRTERSVHGYELTVDLERQRVTGVNGFEARFEIDGYRREMLLRGLDEIGKTLLDERLISAFESRREAGPGRLS